MTRSKILIVDDDPGITAFVTSGLESSGYCVQVAKDGSEMASQLEVSSPDLVILDIMLPDADGVQLCGMIRQRSTIPVIMPSARHEMDVRVNSLHQGADDYMDKPFGMRELVARAGAVLRRYSHPAGGAKDENLADLVSRVEDVAAIDLVYELREMGGAFGIS